MSIERARAFIQRNKWVFAKTYADKAPHEYIFRGKVPYDLQEEFNWFVQHIRDTGYPEKFWSKTFIYLELDGWKYFTMGNPIDVTTIINRARVEQYPSKH